MEESPDNTRQAPEVPGRKSTGVGYQYGVSGLIDRRKPDSRTLFLAGMTRILFETLDTDQLIKNVVSQANPELGSWAIVDTIDEAGAVKRLEVIHPDPAMETLGREVRQRYPPMPSDIFGVLRIMKTQQPELVREIADETMHSDDADRRQVSLLQALGFSTLMNVPLKGRDGLLGAITFIGVEADHRFTPKDLLFAEDLAGRLAMAMDNARLHREAQAAREDAVSALNRAAVADRAKTDFLATMSHELRTPLNAIAGYAELLELGMRGPVTAQQREAIARIRRSEQHLLGVVNDILMLAKTEGGRMPLQLEPTPVQPAVDEVHFLVEPLLGANSLNFKCHECAGDYSVIADRDRLNQILVNLVSNAAKFSYKGGEVCVRCEEREEMIDIHVVDQGQGVDEAKLEEIFQPFVQLSSGLTRIAGGTGLGLPISRELARLMGGDVKAKSRPGAGSTFTLTLPRFTSSAHAS